MQSTESKSEVKTTTDTKRTLLLHGYGVSIRIKDKKLVIRNGEHPLYPESKNEKLVLTDHADFDRIIIQGTSGWISFPALKWLASWGINVLMLDDLGKLYCNINQIEGNSEVLIRQKQYDCFRDAQKRLQLQKWTISHKITSQILLCREFGLTTAIMESLFSKLHSAKIENQIEKIESSVSFAYYSNLARMLKPELEFETRQNPMTRTPRDATDVVNALLNYGYTILKTEIAKQLNTLGFDCFIGFMHHENRGHVSLVYDMTEPFRYLVDKSVIAIANTISKDDYYFQVGNLGYPYRGGSPFFNRWLMLSHDLKKRYLAMLTAILQSKRYQKAYRGRKTEQGFQKMEEVTIMKMKCIELRDYVLGRKNTLSTAPYLVAR